MGEGWLSLLKWLHPLKLSKVGLFRGSDVVLSDYNLSGQHLHQGVTPGLRLCDSYTKALTLCCLTTTCLGCAFVTITPEAPTLCCPTTACLGSTCKVSRLGCANETVTPEDVLITTNIDVKGTPLWPTYVNPW
jgi:hypothetical protein